LQGLHFATFGRHLAVSSLFPRSAGRETQLVCK
jgi:hypothetical protein